MTNLSRHPVLRAIYGASQAIEKCGASRELTDAVMAVTALYAPADGLLDRIASLERQLEDTKRENDMLRGLLGNTATGAWQNVHGVPEEAIRAMRERWEE